MSYTYKTTLNFLVIFGDFRSGSQFEKDKSKLQALIDGSLSCIDLKNVTYMDSDTMKFIKKNENNNIEIHFDKDSYVYKRYIDKYNKGEK